MTENYSKYIALIVGLLAVIGGFFFGNDVYTIGKLLFYVSLMGYYFNATKKGHFLLFIGVFAAFLGKYFFDENFEQYYTAFILCYTECYLGGIVILLPLIRKSRFKIKGVNLLFAFISIVVFAYIIFELFSLSTQKLNEYFFFSVLSLAFTLFVSCCFYIASFSNHPKKIFLFITGIATLLAGLGAMLYVFYINNATYLFMVNLLEIIAFFSFVYFSAYMTEEEKVRSEFI